MKRIVIALLFASSYAVQANILDGVSNVVHDVTDTGVDAVDTVLGRSERRYYKDGRRYRSYENRTVLPGTNNPRTVVDDREVGS
jgi:hypothetical protein